MRDSLVDRERRREGGEREREGERASIQEFCVRKYDFINHWVHMQKTSRGKNIKCAYFLRNHIYLWATMDPKAPEKGVGSTVAQVFWMDRQTVLNIEQ